MVNYGLAYGMNAWGLAQRLDIAPDEAQEIMDAYFASFPGIREYLDRQVGHATVEGFTETILGRRRYIPELQAANPRVRDLGRRQALNAPIQGSASDVFKVAMIAVDAALRAAPSSTAAMLLTVHDELVFEVAGRHGGGGRRAREGADGARRRARGAAPGRRRLGPELVRRRARRSLTRSAHDVDGVSAGHLPSLLAAGLLRRSQIPSRESVSPARQ